MKKIIAAAAGLMLVGGAMVTTASAVENQFGGYWRTRMLTQIDMDGTDSGTYSIVDTRTRLYYTAVFNENFKLVNKFEMDAVWGGLSDSYGDVGADGKAFEIKNTYADFNVGAANFKVGVQGVTISRGLLMDTDASAFIATFKAGNVVLPFAWVKVTEEEADRSFQMFEDMNGGKWVGVANNGTTLIGVKAGLDQQERDHYAFLPVIQAGEGITVQPMVIYDNQEGSDWNNFYVGANVDVKMDAFSAWGTGVYQFGEINDVDLSSFLVAGGVSAGPVHGTLIYATGDDDPFDDEFNNFINPAGASFYWAEILGAGTFDLGRANGPYDVITNVFAAGVGFKVMPMDKLTIGGDVWYAALAEDDIFGETDLGIEIDGKVTYKIYDNLALDLIAAYLIAGDAYGDEDPIEVGARLSLSF